MAPRTPKTQAPTAAEVPVTRAMFGKLRSELLQRIDQAREETKADAQRLDAKIEALGGDLRAEIAGVKAEVDEVKAEIHEVKAEIHAIHAQMSRIEVLVEEQNARNTIVLDALTALLSRQNQVEERVTQVEDTVRKLAAA